MALKSGRSGGITRAALSAVRIAEPEEGHARLLFTENETNNERLFGSPNPTPYVKDGIDNYVVAGREDAVKAPSTWRGLRLRRQIGTSSRVG
jgi:hypothetical protein